MKGMSRHVVPLAIVAAVVGLVTPSAEAKFGVSLVVQPARPIARQPVRMTMRTDVVLPKSESLSLIAVGPWRAHYGQGVRQVRLVRIGARTFKTRLRFPYSGRWRLQVVSESGANLIGRRVMVR
jgi:hypothetical protein